MASSKIKNPTVLTDMADSIKLLGYRNYFVPGGPKASAKAISFGLVTNPAETTTPTEKVISGAPFGPQIDVATFQTRVERTRTFESGASGDPDVRALHSGGLVGVPGASGYAILMDGNKVSTGMLIEIYSNSEDDGLGEIFVAPNITIRGDGIAAGRNGTDETRLKFAERILGSAGYALPAGLGTLDTETLAGGFLIIGVPKEDEDAILDALITGTAYTDATPPTP